MIFGTISQKANSAKGIERHALNIFFKKRWKWLWNDKIVYLRMRKSIKRQICLQFDLKCDFMKYTRKKRAYFVNAHGLPKRIVKGKRQDRW